jgi:glycosyltransferase involved in cell wall biosynthesis
MATFNGEAFLPEQLQSLSLQSVLPSELVVSDDASDDSTLEILERFANASPFPVIVLPNQERVGYAHNFGRALANCSGNLIFLCDQDDFWLNNKIERVVHLYNRHPNALLFINNADIADQRLTRSGFTALGQIRAAGLSDTEFVKGCCSAVTRTLLEIALPIPGDVRAHDSWLSTIANGLHRRVVTDEVLQIYRRHGLNTSQWVANSPNRIRRRHILRSRWHSLTRSLILLHRLRYDARNSSISPTEVLASRLAILETSVSLEDLPSVQQFRSHLESSVSTSHQRARVRQGNLAMRTARALQAKRDGLYGDSGWFCRGLLRDILFK